MDKLAGGYGSASSSSSSSSSSSRSSNSDFPDSTGPSTTNEVDEFRVVSVSYATEGLGGTSELTPSGPVDADTSSGRPAQRDDCVLEATGETSLLAKDRFSSGATTRPVGNRKLEKWISEAHDMREKHGIRFNEVLKDNPMFQNPGLCTSIIQNCDLDEHGTFIPEEKCFLSPKILECGFYDVLGKRQHKLAEENAKNGRPGLLAPK